MILSEPQSIYQTVESEFDCHHSRSEIRYKITRNGSRQYYRQCLNCGQALTSAIAYSKIDNCDAIQPFDDDLREARDYEKSERRRELSRIQREDFFEHYADHLDSDKWKHTRLKVLERDKHLCQACRDRKATQVHHMPGSYKYIPYEPLFLLVSVCDECHEIITSAERRTIAGV